MFGHDYSDEELKVLNDIREKEIFSSISPAGIHGDDYSFSNSTNKDDNFYKDKYLKLAKENKRLRILIKILKVKIRRLEYGKS